MTDDRATIATILSKAAGVLNRDARRDFRAFLASLPGAPTKRRKVHSWRKAKPAPRRARPARQMNLQL